MFSETLSLLNMDLTDSASLVHQWSLGSAVSKSSALGWHAMPCLALEVVSQNGTLGFLSLFCLFNRHSTSSFPSSHLTFLDGEIGEVRVVCDCLSPFLTHHLPHSKSPEPDTLCLPTVSWGIMWLVISPTPKLTEPLDSEMCGHMVAKTSLLML